MKPELRPVIRDPDIVPILHLSKREFETLEAAALELTWVGVPRAPETERQPFGLKSIRLESVDGHVATFQVEVDP